MSPEAASLLKFGNLPVSYNTGTIAVSVPIFDIECGQLRLPISLDYHSGGIKVDEGASCVGLGWALNAGGNISRNMIGRPDEEATVPNAQSVLNDPRQYYSYIYGVRSGSSDAEPDVFQYSAGGVTGKFIFKRDGSIVQIPQTNSKITFDGSSFTIIDPNGNSYCFNEKRKNTLAAADFTGTPYVSTWCLTQITDANSVDKINFIYESNIYSSYEKTINYTQNFGITFTTKQQIDFSTGIPYEVPQVNSDIGPHQLMQNITHEDFYLKEINWRNGKIIFNNVNDRTDLPAGTGLRLNSVDVYALNGSNNVFIKRVKLFQSYFFSNLPGNVVFGYPAISDKNYRLKLDSVGNQNIISNVSDQVYQMEYNSNPLPPKGSFAQDRWGFYNGHNENTDLMQTQTAAYNGLIYTFGGANRETDPIQCLSNILTSIKYPTKGKTVFEFEPHQYHTFLPVVTTKNFSQSLSPGALNTTPSYTSGTFTVNNNSSNFSYQVFISKFNYSDVTDRPRVTLTDQTTGQMVVQVSTIPTTATDKDYNSGNIAMTLVQGHTYLLEINIYTNNPKVTANATITWQESLPGTPDIKMGGGLRIKSQTNYDIDGKFIGKEIYTYGTDNTGQVLTPQYFQNINYETVVHRIGGSFMLLNGVISGCMYLAENDKIYLDKYLSYTPPGYSTIYHANSILPTSQYSGSPVLYTQVTKSQVDALGNTNGKTVYNYNVATDASITPFQPITSTSAVLNNYVPSPGVAMISNTWKNGALLSEEQYKSSAKGFELINRRTSQYATNLQSFEYYLKLTSNYSHSGCEFTGSNAVITDFQYTLVPIGTGAIVPITTTETTMDDNGNANTITRNITYGSVTPLLASKIEWLSSKGILNSTQMKYPKDFSVSGNVYEKMVNRNILAPVVQNKQFTAGIQNKSARVYYYDWFNDSKLILPQSAEQQTLNYPVETNLYFNKYDQYGNILEQQKANDTKEVYLWGYNSSYPVAKIINTTYDIAKTYITQSFLDNPSDDATLRNHLSNLRNIPGAMVSTYTYAPLIGMTSETDANGRTIYYNYDPFGRLVLVRDKDNNIVKKICYNYYGQPGVCSLFGNQAQSGPFTRNNCSSGAISSSVTYTVPANKYYATTQTDANTLATNEVNANGQAYANTNGTCTVPSIVSVSGQNITTVYGYVQFTNTVTGAYNSLYLYPNSNTSISLPAGTYNISFSESSSPQIYTTFRVNGYSSYGTSATFSSMNISTGSVVRIGN